MNKHVQKIAEELGIEHPAEIGSYTARHSFSAIHYKKNKDIIAFKNQLGHTSVLMTQKYLKSLGFDDKGKGDQISDFFHLSLE